MQIQVNGEPIAAMPAEIRVTILDLDDADGTSRTANGTLSRDRIAVKRQVELSFNALTSAQISGVLQQTSGVFFEFTYPDPMDGGYETRTMYVGDRPANIPFERDGVIYWQDFKITLTEQ